MSVCLCEELPEIKILCIFAGLRASKIPAEKELVAILVNSEKTSVRCLCYIFMVWGLT